MDINVHTCKQVSSFGVELYMKPKKFRFLWLSFHEHRSPWFSWEEAKSFINIGTVLDQQETEHVPYITPLAVEWTGRTDTNGIEIYEGDIVEYKGDQAIIVWDKDGWRIISKEFGMEQSFALGTISGKELKVVGSRYEPEPENMAGAEQA